MTKNILFIEDEYGDFESFSKILTGYNIFPQDINNKDELSAFLLNNTYDYQQLKENVFNYIIDKKLYENDKLFCLILDINLLGKDKYNNLDESGIKLLGDFRDTFYQYFKDKKGEDKKYENWSNTVSIIALTKFPKDKCRQLESVYGRFFVALNKEDIMADNAYLLTKLNNMLEQKTHDKEHQQNQPKEPTTIIYSDYIRRDKIMGNQNKTYGNKSPIINGNNNIVNSYNGHEQKLIQKLKINGVSDENQQAELIIILREEQQDTENRNWGTRLKGWFANLGQSVISDTIAELIVEYAPLICAAATNLLQ